MTNDPRHDRRLIILGFAGVAFFLLTLRFAIPVFRDLALRSAFIIGTAANPRPSPET